MKYRTYSEVKLNRKYLGHNFINVFVKVFDEGFAEIIYQNVLENR